MFFIPMLMQRALMDPENDLILKEHLKNQSLLKVKRLNEKRQQTVNAVGTIAIMPGAILQLIPNPSISIRQRKRKIDIEKVKDISKLTLGDLITLNKGSFDWLSIYLIFH